MSLNEEGSLGEEAGMVRISWYSNRYRLMSIVISFRKCSRYRIRLRILSWMVVDLSTIHHSALSIIRIPVVLIHGCRLSATYSPMTGKKYDM